MEKILKSLIFLVLTFLIISCSDEIPDKVEDSSKEIVKDSPKVEAEKYFPLNIGDKFVFDWQSSNYCYDFGGRWTMLYKKHIEVINDTLIESKKYFVVKRYQDIYEWEYFDFLDDDSDFHYKDTSIIRDLRTEYYRISDEGVLHRKEKWAGSISISSMRSIDLAATEVDSIYSEYPNYDIYNDPDSNYGNFYGLKEIGKDTIFGKVLDKKVYMRTDFENGRTIVTFTKGLGLVYRDNDFCGNKGGVLKEAYINGIKYSE